MLVGRDLLAEEDEVGRAVTLFDVAQDLKNVLLTIVGSTELMMESIGGDLNLKIQPGLAETWEHPDATTWRFNVRKNVKFTDGTVLNAAIVKASYDRAAKPAPAPAKGFRRRARDRIATCRQPFSIRTSELNRAWPYPR